MDARPDREYRHDVVARPDRTHRPEDALRRNLGAALYESEVGERPQPVDEPAPQVRRR